MAVIWSKQSDIVLDYGMLLIACSIYVFCKCRINDWLQYVVVGKCYK